MTDVFKLIEKHGIELHGEIEYFAELIRQDEKEACAKVCDIEADEWGTNSDGAYAAKNCGERIRERG